jgi:hypothetical protein
MKTINFDRWLQGTALAWLLSALTWIGFAHLDPDLGWHLRIGQDIAQSGQVPHDQFYLHTLAGQNWVDHEWFTNWLMHLIYQQGSYLSLVLLFVLLTTALLYFLVRRPLQQYRAPASIIIWCWLGLGLVSMHGHLGPRAQVLGMIFFAAELFMLRNWQKSGQWQKLQLLPLLFLLWANMHGSFPFGLAVLALYLLLQAILPAIRRLATWGSIWPVLALGCASVLATLITPYGWQLYQFLFTYADTSYLQHIVEWYPIYNSNMLYLHISFIGAAVAQLLVGWQKKRSFRPLTWADLSLLLILLTMSVSASRHFLLLFVGATIIILPFFLDNFIDDQASPIRNPLWLFPLAVIWVFSLGLLTASQFSTNPFSSFCQDYPCGAVQYLKEHPQLQQLKWFNDFNIGGYLIQTLPTAKLYIDGRLPQATYRGQAILNQYMKLKHDQDIAKTLILDGYQLIIWQKEKPRPTSWFNNVFNLNPSTGTKPKLVIDRLKASPLWKLSYEDQATYIWTKR